MWVERLEVSGWRNHESSGLSLTPGITILVGANGQGKTNLVEGLYFLATLGSHRVSTPAALIRDGAESATLYADLRHDDRVVSVGLTLKRRGASEAVVNGAKAKPSALPYWASVVMFAPEDMGIVRGEPGARRGFMDQLVVSGSPAMAATYQDFDRVLRQRNSLLKTLKTARGTADHSTLDVWDEKFISLGAAIITQRCRHLDAVMPLVAEHYSALADHDVVSYRYVSAIGSNETVDFLDGARVHEALTNELRARRADEIDRGQTLVGPQRDDVDLLISGKPARTHASQGEGWSLALSLRLATAAWLRNTRSSGDPVIILDDVFAELDARRRERLVALVSGYQQILVTTAVEEDLPSQLTGVVHDVAGGVVRAR